MNRQGTEPGPICSGVCESEMGLQEQPAPSSGLQSPCFRDAGSSSPCTPDQPASTSGVHNGASSPRTSGQPAPTPGLKIRASATDSEMQLRGPITRLRAKRLQQYLQGVLRRQFELIESGQIFTPSSPHPVSLLMNHAGDLTSPHSQPANSPTRQPASPPVGGGH